MVVEGDAAETLSSVKMKEPPVVGEEEGRHTAMSLTLNPLS